MAKWGFVGGGRATRIILGGFERAKVLPEEVVVSDRDSKVLEGLVKSFPFVKVVESNALAADADVVFLSVPFTVMEQVLGEIKNTLRPESILVSLAPKFTVARIAEILGGFDRIVRIIPNAASIINKGFNPVFFSSALSDEERESFRRLLAALGEFAEVEEGKLEAYVMATAAAPAYFWFQFVELVKISRELGLEDKEAWRGVCSMLKGAVEFLCCEEFSVDEVMDLIPFKPLAKVEDDIKRMFRERIFKAYEKIKP